MAVKWHDDSWFRSTFVSKLTPCNLRGPVPLQYSAQYISTGPVQCRQGWPLARAHLFCHSPLVINTLLPLLISGPGVPSVVAVAASHRTLGAMTPAWPGWARHNPRLRPGHYYYHTQSSHLWPIIWAQVVTQKYLAQIQSTNRNLQLGTSLMIN